MRSVVWLPAGWATAAPTAGNHTVPASFVWAVFFWRTFSRVTRSKHVGGAGRPRICNSLPFLLTFLLMSILLFKLIIILFLRLLARRSRLTSRYLTLNLTSKQATLSTLPSLVIDRCLGGGRRASVVM